MNVSLHFSVVPGVFFDFELDLAWGAAAKAVAAPMMKRLAMATPQVEQVRSFNRLVTEQVGALNDHFLGHDHSLGESRLLWEIGEDGAEVRELRSRFADGVVGRVPGGTTQPPRGRVRGARPARRCRRRERLPFLVPVARPVRDGSGGPSMRQARLPA